MAPLLRLVFALILIGVTSTPAVARQGGGPLDLAAMALSPNDLEAAGWEGLGLQAGWRLSAEDLAYRAVWPTGEGEEQDAVRDALLEAGWQQGHATTFATFWDPSRADASRQVEIEVVAYADVTGAAKGFDRVPDFYETGPAEAIAGVKRIGDEARLVRVDARDPQAGMPAQELVLGFRHDRLTARVMLRDWTGAEPTVAAAEALAARLLTRMERVLADGQPGLSLQGLSVEGAEYAVRFDYYARLDGEDTRLVYESPEALATRTAGYGGAIDVFASGTETAASGSGYTLVFVDTLYRFADADRASGWLRETSERHGQDAEITAFVIESEDAVIGEESLALSFSHDFGSDGLDVVHTSALFFRIGAVVAEIRLTRTNNPPLASTTRELAAAQAECLLGSGCLPWRGSTGDTP
jgi:hypothetical protein